MRVLTSITNYSLLTQHNALGNIIYYGINFLMSNIYGHIYYLRLSMWMSVCVFFLFVFLKQELKNKLLTCLLIMLYKECPFIMQGIKQDRCVVISESIRRVWSISNEGGMENVTCAVAHLLHTG